MTTTTVRGSRSGARRARWGLAALLSFMGVAGVAVAHGGGGGRDHDGFGGQITGGIDSEAREFRARVDRRTEATVRVLPDAIITKNGELATFADLAEGDSFRAMGRAISRRPLVFEARALGAFDGDHRPDGPPDQATGTIASIDAEATTFVLRSSRHGDTTVDVIETTQIVKDGAAVDFSALAVDDHASVRGERRTTDSGEEILVAFMVRAGTSDGGGHDHDHDGLIGRIIGAPNAETREFNADSCRRSVTVRVTEDAIITRNGEPATFADLADGDGFRAMGSVVSTEPFVFEATAVGAFVGDAPPHGPRDHAEGTIASIDSEALTFVIHSERSGDDTTVAVSDSTRITKDGAPADFAALAVGDRASARGRRETTDEGGTILRAFFVRAATPNGP